MANERSRQKLLDFMDYLAIKGLMAKPTAASRKAAASRVLTILSDEEAEDVTVLDLDAVMTRFNNLEGRNYTPASLKTYLSRLKSAINDFKVFLENPLAFKPSIQIREKRKLESKREEPASTRAIQQPSADRHVVKAPLSNSILPIPIRLDVTIFVQGLPYDLTEAEANKIANVIRAMATPA